MRSDELRRHVPGADILSLEIPAFEDALRDALKPHTDYDQEKWLFVPDRYTEYRYILGTRGRRPLICIGINPSTARPDRLDPTLKSVERIALCNGYDSFLMFNICAQRATSPDDMAKICNARLHQENLKAFDYALRLSPSPTVWAAWGTVIEKRDYLKDHMLDLVRTGERYGAKWVCAGAVSKKGHPHHPLYLKKDEPLRPFDITAYLQTATA